MFFELVVCFKGGLAYVADLKVELVSKEVQSLTKAIIFELFYYINGYFRV